MMYYHIYLYHGNKHNYHCVITKTLQNGQTLGQFFELLYLVTSPTDVLSLLLWYMGIGLNSGLIGIHCSLTRSWSMKLSVALQSIRASM